MKPGEKFDSLLAEWRLEGEITATNIATAMTKQMQLYAHFKKEYKDAVHTLRIAENFLKKLRHAKFRYYSGFLTPQEIEDQGWKQDPYDGALRPSTIKDRNEFVDRDEEVLEAEAEVTDAKLLKELCEDILNQIRYRSQTVTATMETIKFNMGL